MKTIQHVSHAAQITRIGDNEAEKLVWSGSWKYVPKSLWKEKVRNPALEAKKNKSKKDKKK